ncbi:hypothetical protein [Nocardia altamirensis]|uniref:hypothetical protein n=1 Tax=Nocardia altamirensis TaxID=472158 RepID=UPI000A4CC805|nr:hypothetical protein [Nocardia altamirensis]
MIRKTVLRVGRNVLTAAVLPFAVVATVASAGTSSATDFAAEQARLAGGLVASASDQGVNYKTTTAPDLKTITTTLDNGKFTLTADASAVKVESATGAKVSEFPLSLKTVAGNTIALAPQVSLDGKTLTLNPQVSAEVAAEAKTAAADIKPVAAADLKPIATNPDAQNHDPVANGLAAGATVGLAVAAVLCIPAILVFIVGYFACIIASGISYVVFAAVIGAILGAVAPQIIPQMLP